MKNFEIGQNFWDDQNAREIEVIEFNGTDYWCRTVEGACDEDAGSEGLQWFTVAELRNLKPSI